MPDKLDVPPTRGNLLRLRDHLDQLQEGHEILDRKRQVFIHELFNRIEEAEQIEEEAREQFKKAHEAINLARMDIGMDRLQWISLAASVNIQVDIETQSVMGVMAALVNMRIETLRIPYSPGDTDSSMDRAHQEWLKIARLLGSLVEKTVTVWRMAMELRKTQRQVNALEEIIIPRYQATINNIADILEEKEREEIIHAKKVKQLLK